MMSPAMHGSLPEHQVLESIKFWKNGWVLIRIMLMPRWPIAALDRMGIEAGGFRPVL
ncbi:hypothetical protein ACVIHI_003107 [Bradyrhizobium sp. USDA 4524]|nr:hypothetical protein [Bradyrhizobium sp. USDA 4538]MCP1904540.1 hypothetical protein [Bradyrhizobium sp. USDA 4537]MCP1989804.1 hypothetical protein [Bradyrhizobium sp. USDA 4539]